MSTATVRPALNASVIESLRRFSTPTISNAIETFHVRHRMFGVTGAGIRCFFPELGPVVGYACTALVKTATPPDEPRRVNRRSYWEYVRRSPGPKVCVVQDLSPAPGGAYWGEVNASMHKALGASAVLTNGTVRDIDEVERLGFGFFASGLQVSHGFAHLEDYNQPVEIFGMRVEPGDLIHADKHGAVVIPIEIAPQLADAAQQVELSERLMLAACALDDAIPELDKLISAEY